MSGNVHCFFKKMQARSGHLEDFGQRETAGKEAAKWRKISIGRAAAGLCPAMGAQVTGGGPATVRLPDALKTGMG